MRLPHCLPIGLETRGVLCPFDMHSRKSKTIILISSVMQTQTCNDSRSTKLGTDKTFISENHSYYLPSIEVLNRQYRLPISPLQLGIEMYTSYHEYPHR